MVVVVFSQPWGAGGGRILGALLANQESSLTDVFQAK